MQFVVQILSLIMSFRIFSLCLETGSSSNKMLLGVTVVDMLADSNSDGSQRQWLH